VPTRELTPGPPERMWRLSSWLVNQVASRAYRVVSEELAHRGAHTSQFAVLNALDEFGSYSQATLVRRLGMDRSDMVATLDLLEDRGFVTRAPDPTDRRRNIVQLTPQGRREFARLVELVDAAQERVFSGLSARERADLHALLLRVFEQHTNWRLPPQLSRPGKRGSARGQRAAG
jgi:MarR family transcriptional regulator, lower aerobic nicotinate degradation pathway regulator